jgi:predicted metal-binding protein
MIKDTFTAVAHTKSALIKYSIEVCLITSKDCFLLEDKQKFQRLCSDGCMNFSKKWSCPPYAPLFQDFCSKWDKLYVLHMSIDTDQLTYVKNDYLKIKAANSILKSRADKFLCKVAREYGRYISTGSCRLCNPCKCKNNLPCAHPEIMTYSYEALGVDVSKLVNMCFQKPLLWYKPQSMPRYTSVVCGLLTNKTLPMESLKDEYFKFIKS